MCFAAQWQPLCIYTNSSFYKAQRRVLQHQNGVTKDLL